MTDSLQKQYTNLLSSINKVSYLLNKHDGIRLKHWLDKLASPMNNMIWKQNRNLYLKILLQMTTQGELMKPFNQSPPQGPLPRITIYDVPYPIRIKLNQQQHKNTPSQNRHKTSYHSRKNSLSTSGNNTINIKLQRSLSKQNNNIMEHKKKIIFDAMISIDDNKQNDSIVINQRQRISQYQYRNINMKRQNSYEEQYQSRTRTISKSNNKSKDKDKQKDLMNSSKNSTSKFPFQQKQRMQKNNDFCQNYHQKQTNKRRGCQILKKSLKFLAKYSQQFGHSIKYKQLLQKIVQAGDKLGQNFRQVSIPNIEDHSNNNSVYIDKYNQRIKNKLFQTDLNTMEFMSYLNSLA